MAQPTPVPPDAAQAEALALLVELEACWQNVPAAPAGGSAREGLLGLRAKQRAFDAYHAQLVAYNKRYRPVHEAERPLSSPARLAAWCRAMSGLYRRAGHAACPVHLVEKAYRCADRLGARLAADFVRRPPPVTTTADAIEGLGAIADWCDALPAAAGGGPRPTAAQGPRT
jgi:hypothetical protein